MATDPYLLDIRVRSLWAPYDFTKTVLGYPDLIERLHQHDNELFISRLIAGERYQFVEWPRRFFKTTTFTLGTGMWLVLPVTQEDTDYAVGTLRIPEADWLARMRLHDPNKLQLIAMETDDNAMKKVGWIKNQFESNSLFRALFPSIAYQGDEEPWNMSGIKIRRTGSRRYEQEGTFDAIGVGVSLQSRHYDCVWEDDLVGEKAIKSPSEMERTIDWHSRLDGAFVDPATQMRFGVSNRWGYNDLNSWIRLNEPQVVFYTRRAVEIIDGTETAIFPERFPLDEIVRMRARMHPRDFAAQYMNEPQLPGEKAVDLNRIHKYTVDSDAEGRGQIICSCGKRFYPSQLNIYMHFDPHQARASARSTSKPCISVVGTSIDKHVFLIDYFIGQRDYAGIYREIVRLNDIWYPQLFTYEDVGSQNMIEQYMRQMQSTPDFLTGKVVNPEKPRKHGHRKFPSIKPVPTKSKPKEERIATHFFPVIENMKFACRAKHTMLMSQLETFPHPAFDHDYDLLDTLAQGAIVWRFPTPEDEVVTAKRDEDEYLQHLGKPHSVMMHTK